MAYEWSGMQKLSFDEVEELHKKGELVGCYLLYSDNTESMIEEDYKADDIAQHYLNGGEFGKEILREEEK